jgi:hypothetical protein
MKMISLFMEEISSAENLLVFSSFNSNKNTLSSNFSFSISSLKCFSSQISSYVAFPRTSTTAAATTTAPEGEIRKEKKFTREKEVQKKTLLD